MRTSTLQIGTWYYLLAIRDSSKGSSQQLKLYVNGNDDTNSIYVVGNPQSIQNTGNLKCGYSVYQMSYGNAKLNDVRIYNRALSQAEITMLYEGYYV